MNRIGSLLALFVLSLFVGWAVAAEPKGKDVDLLQGDWRAVRTEHNGESKEADNNGLKVRIKGDKVYVLVNGKPTEEGITMRLDDSVSPKLIDAVLPNKSVLEGIYKLDGKRWTVCIRTDADVKDRPGEFASKAGNLIVIEFEKE